MCGTCRDAPLWGCSLFGCSTEKSCFIICPECGQTGFGAKPEVFNPDMELATLLLIRLGRI